LDVPRLALGRQRQDALGLLPGQAFSQLPQGHSAEHSQGLHDVGVTLDLSSGQHKDLKVRESAPQTSRHAWNQPACYESHLADPASCCQGT